VRIAADANALLAAVLGGRAKLILQHPEVEEVFTADETFVEVQEYAPVLAGKRRLHADLVQLSVTTLPVTIVPQTEYARWMPEAAKRIGKRDPDDVPILAVALSLNVPLWSNDRDFSGVGVEWYTTERLLRELGVIQ